MDKYFVVVKDHPPIEITKEQFMAAEQHHGFRSKFSGHPATGGFGAGPIVSYSVRYVPEIDASSTPHS
jgi:hypothetical protein